MDQQSPDLGRRCGVDRRKGDRRSNSLDRRINERRKGERRQIGDGDNLNNLCYDMHSSNSDLIEIRDEIHKISQQIKDGK